MNGTSLFVDTNILIYLINGNPEIVDSLTGKKLYTSVINEIELRAFPNLTKQEENNILELLGDIKILPLSNEVKEVAIQIKKTSKIKLPDAIVAASAFSENLPLFTADKDFIAIEQINLLLYDI